MKQSLLFYLFLYHTLYNCFAQLPTSIDEDRKWGCAININSINMMPGYAGGYLQYYSDGSDGSLSGAGERANKSLSMSITPKYYLSNEILLRCELGMSFIRMTRNSDVLNNNTREIYSVEVKQNSNRCAPGVEFGLVRKKTIELTTGVIAPISIYGNLSFSDSSFSRDGTTNSLISWWTGRTNVPGGFSIGIGPVASINIKLFKNILFGAESSYAFSYSNVGGTLTSNSTTYSSPSSPPQISSNDWRDTFTGLHFSKIYSSIHISFNIN